LDIADCHFQKFAAKLVESVYTLSRVAVESVLALRYPGTLAAYYPPASMPQPGVAIALIGTTTLVAISGTTNLLQWLGQVLSGLVAPFDNGHWSTYSFWNTAANYVLSKISLTAANPDGQIVFVGHSYGGATANICALICKQANKERRVSLLTFGSPKTGDERFNLALRGLQHIHLVADGDIVPYTPPSGTTATLLVWLISSGVLRSCSSLAWLENSERLLENGNRLEIADEDAPYDILLDYFLTYVLAPATLVPGWQHWMENYVRLIVCPGEDPSRPQIEPIAACFDGSAKYGEVIVKGSGGMMFDGTADQGGDSGGAIATGCCAEATPRMLYCSVTCSNPTLSRSLEPLIYDDASDAWLASIAYDDGPFTLKWYCSFLGSWLLESPSDPDVFRPTMPGACVPYLWEGEPQFVLFFHGSIAVTVAISVRDTP